MIRPASLSDVMVVLSNLRPEDEAEYQASLGALSRGMASTHLWSARPFCWCASLDGDPIAVFAAHRSLPHVFGLTLAATDRWKEVGKEVTKWVWQDGFPAMWAAGCRRATAVMVDGHPTAGQWLEVLGATHEAEMPLAGVNQETMHLYAFRAIDPAVRKRLERANVSI